MEKRAHMRLRFSGPKEQGFDPLGGIIERHHDNEVIDMSTSGACVRTSTRHEPGKKAVFELHLSDAGEKISQLAEVKWVKRDDKKFLVGLKFV